MSNDILTSLLKEAENEYASIVEDGIEAGDITCYFDTGSYSLNALLSGSIYGGLPGNKVTALAGEPSTGKTFYAINILKTLLDTNSEAFVFYFESESAVSKSMFEDRKVDTKRIAVIPVSTVQEFRTQAVKILDAYLKIPEKDRKPMLFVLDSLGNLSTDKEVEDIASGKDTRDMTRAQLIRAAFRVLTLKLGKAKVPLIVTNHVYQVVGSYVPMQKMGGGCLVAGTKVQTPDGMVEIQNVKCGDVVSTLFGDRKVTDTFEFQDKSIIEIEFEDGTKVECSKDHKFLVSGEWITAGDLLDMAQNTESIHIDVADINGTLDVYRKQIYENLLFVNAKGKAA